MKTYIHSYISHAYNTFFVVNIINKNNRTLDLVLANVNDIVVTREQQPLVPVDAHHPPLLIDFRFLKRIKSTRTRVTTAYNFLKCNFENLYRELASADWEMVTKTSTVEAVVDMFYIIIYATFDHCVPQININHKFMAAIAAFWLTCL